MPTSPATLCRDCSRRAVTEGYCADHQTQNRAAEHKIAFDRNRDQNDPIRKLYKCQRWQRTRHVVMRRDLLCCECGYRAATECDHVIKARVILEKFGIDAFYDPNRCQGLCHQCHSIKT